MVSRHQFRASWHDYNNGIYFVTICSRNKLKIFGKISENQMIKTVLGEIVENSLLSIPEIHDDAEIKNYVIMPNHVHLIIAVGSRDVENVGTRYIASAESVPAIGLDISQPIGPRDIGCLKPPMYEPPTDDYHHSARLAVIIGTFKAAVTRSARSQCVISESCWQPRFHEHMIKDQRAYDYIMNYIENNVANWDKDCFSDDVT